MRTQYWNTLYLLIFCCCLVTSAFAEESQNLNYQTYKVVPQAGQTLLAAINAASTIRENGKIFHGNTKWHINWRFRLRPQPDGSCTIAGVKTSTASIITLPKLIATDSDIVSPFSTYIEALNQHELGHVKIATDAAHEIDQQISALPAMGNCPQLGAAANKIGYQLLDAARVRGRNYDLETGHGKSQGAWLPR